MNLFYGNIQNCPSVNSIAPDYNIFNFSSLSELYPNIGLIPPNNLGALNEYDFDVKYSHYLIDNDMIFIRFMNIILSLYSNRSVYLIIDTNDSWSMMLIESLMKFILARYGIPGYFVNSPEDIEYQEIFNADQTNFAPGYGVQNLINDKERYLYLYNKQEILTGNRREDYDD